MQAGAGKPGWGAESGWKRSPINVNPKGIGRWRGILRTARATQPSNPQTETMTEVQIAWDTTKAINLPISIRNGYPSQFDLPSSLSGSGGAEPRLRERKQW